MGRANLREPDTQGYRASSRARFQMILVPSYRFVVLLQIQR